MHFFEREGLSFNYNFLEPWLSELTINQHHISIIDITTAQAADSDKDRLAV